MKQLPHLVTVNEHGNVIVPDEQKRPAHVSPASENIARLWAAHAIKEGYDPNGIIFINGKVRSLIRVRDDGSIHIHHA